MVISYSLGKKSLKYVLAVGGGSVTFGAPMVIYADNGSRMYAQLRDLEAAAEAAGLGAAQAAAAGAGVPPRRGAARLRFHNFVNNLDLVPRLLGRSLDSVHTYAEALFPSLRVRTRALCELSM